MPDESRTPFDPSLLHDDGADDGEVRVMTRVAIIGSGFARQSQDFAAAAHAFLGGMIARRRPGRV